MALLWADNFAWYTTNQRLRYYVSGSAADVSIGAFGATGGPAVRFTAVTGELVALPVQPAASGATAIHSFDFRISSAPAATTMLANVRLGATIHVSIAITTSRTLAAYRGDTAGTLLGTSTYVCPLNTRLHFNLRVVIDNAGSVLLKITEAGTTTIALTLTSVDTQNGGSATWDRGAIHGAAGTGGTTDIENLIMQDATGTSANDLLGPDVEVKGFRPNGVGFHNDWDRVGSVFRFQNVDESSANDDTDYNKTDTVNAIDTHELDDLIDPSLTVYGIVSVSVARRATGAATIAPVIREGITTSTGSNFSALTSAYLAYPAAYTMRPSGSAWSVDEWNAIQLGYQRTA